MGTLRGTADVQHADVALVLLQENRIASVTMYAALRLVAATGMNATPHLIAVAVIIHPSNP